MQLKTGKLLCNGLSEEKLEIAGITSLKKDETWQEYRTKWQQQLTLLAEEFQIWILSTPTHSTQHLPTMRFSSTLPFPG